MTRHPARRTPLLAAALVGVALLSSSAPLCAESLAFVATYPLDPQLAADFNNGFHPQGLGFDDATGELLYAQQHVSAVIRTDQQGNILGQTPIATIMTLPPSGTTGDANHMTCVAADATYYYFSDYTCNTSCYDLHRIPKAGGATTTVSTEVAAYGGYPIDVRAGRLYRPNISTNYDWTPLNQMRISDITSADTFIQTYALTTPFGMGDISVDLDGDKLWLIEYRSGAAIRLYDLATGALEQTFALALNGLNGGIAYGNNRLFFYEWRHLSGSTLTVYDVVRAAALRVVDATPTMVTQGSSGHAVSVTLENLGLNPVDVSTFALEFTGTADRSGEYTVTPSPANPTTLPGATTLQFDFSVDVSASATVEAITIDASFTGVDSVTLGPVADVDADTTDTWDVLACLTTLCGDCDLNGQVTIIDALLAAQHAAAIITLAGAPFTNCNVIGVVEPAPGAVVDILDALTVAQAAAALPVTLSCC